MYFKIKGDKFQLCETVNENVQNGMNYLEIAISVLGNDQAVTDYLSEKLNIFQKLYSWMSIGVEKRTFDQMTMGRTS